VCDRDKRSSTSRCSELTGNATADATINPDGLGGDGVGDLLIVDISNPRDPALIGEFGVLDEPRLGIPVYVGSQRGGDARTYLHGVKANREGTLVTLAYWDSGFINLDLTDPTQPVFLGRFAYGATEEGNAHSSTEITSSD
jgi:hypothetical protein